MSRQSTQFTAVYLILEKDGKTLLLRRANTGFEDGSYGLVAGHIEEGETAREAMQKEAKEEAGIVVEIEDMRVAHTMHRYSGDREYVDVYIITDEWSGEIVNMEPEKCDDLSWFDMNQLPENVIPYVEQALHAVRDGDAYSEYGWENR